MKKPFCPSLWYAPYITSDGKVYGCCSRKSVVFGNIYRDDLNTIWNSPAARKYRSIALRQGLACFQDCNIPKERLPSKLALDKKLPAIDQARPCDPVIELSTRCNLRCVMCRQDHHDKKTLDVNILKDHTPWKEIRDMTIQGGEFLILENAADFFDDLIERNIRPSLYTNGTVMNKAWAEKIARHAAFIHFSLNAATKETHEKVNRGSRWETVLRNIAMVASYKKKLRTRLGLGGHMTIVPENIFEIPLFIKKYRQFGFDCIDFSVDFASVPAFLKKHPGIKSRLRSAVRKAIHNTRPIKASTDTLKAFGLY